MCPCVYLKTLGAEGGGGSGVRGWGGAWRATVGARVLNGEFRAQELMGGSGDRAALCAHEPLPPTGVGGGMTNQQAQGVGWRK